jgi:hypothetical protein
MSKPASTGAKSLEEILASIRKSLAEEAPERPSPPVPGPAKAAQTEVKPAKMAAQDVGVGANGAGFSNRLAAALNGPSSAPAGEEDLNDLLSTEPTKPVAAVTPAAPAKPADAVSANGKDPLWFLSRLSGAAGGGATGAAARARDAAKSATPPAPVEEVKLSRPEELRPNLPPLFGNGEAAAASAPTAEAPPATAKAEEQWQLRTEPRMPRPSDKSSAAFASAKPEAPPTVAEAPREPTAPSESLSSLPEEPVPSEPLLGPVLVSEPALVPLPSEASSIEAARALPSTDVGMPTILPTRALEQVVAELLEPVIQQWLQSNLPRLIEKVVREEAAKAVATAREPNKV